MTATSSYLNRERRTLDQAMTDKRDAERVHGWRNRPAEESLLDDLDYIRAPLVQALERATQIMTADASQAAGLEWLHRHLTDALSELDGVAMNVRGE